MAAGGYIACDAGAGRFWLTPEQAAVYVDQESPAYAMPFLVWAPRLAGALPALEEAFRTGGGVPYEAVRTRQRRRHRQRQPRRLSHPHGGAGYAPCPTCGSASHGHARSVLDIGCGHGWSSIALAHDAACEAIDRRGGRRSGVAGRARSECEPRQA